MVNTCTPGYPEEKDSAMASTMTHGEVDEDFVGEATECGVEVVTQAVKPSVNGTIVDTCIAPVVAEATQLATASTTTVMARWTRTSEPARFLWCGACTAEGMTSCIEGVEVVMDCAPGVPAEGDATAMALTTIVMVRG